MSRYHTSYGQPILSPNGDDIWAYWAVNNQYNKPNVHFHTESALLDNNFYEETVKEKRQTIVSINSAFMWKASNHCIQQDFKECDLFFVSDHSGPDAVNKSLNILLNDDKFQRHFKDSRATYGKNVLTALREYIEINDIYLHNPPN